MLICMMFDVEETRLLLERTAYCDVHDEQSQKWIRVKTKPGDRLVIPDGINHRFTSDAGDYVHVDRLFNDEPNPTAHPERAEKIDTRIAYIQEVEMLKGTRAMEL
jgi:1,2-dihydroxy-3-keto-5-methylthiopentene dioxygenase